MWDIFNCFCCVCARLGGLGVLCGGTIQAPLYLSYFVFRCMCGLGYPYFLGFDFVSLCVLFVLTVDYEATCL